MKKIVGILVCTLLIVTALPAVGAVINQCIQPPPGLISWWSLDETSGLIAYDFMNRNHGTHVPSTNGPTPVQGKVAGALYFDGTDDYVEVDHDPSFNTTNGSFTIDAWIKFDNNLNPYMPVIAKYGKYDSQTNTRFGFQFSIIYGNPQMVISGPNLFFSCGFTPAVHLGDGQWHFVVIVVNNDLNPTHSSVFSYVDGKYQDSGTAGPQINTNNEGNLKIGKGTKLMGPNQDEYFFNGSIDEVEIFDRVLLDSEIVDIYNAGSMGKCKPWYVDVNNGDDNNGGTSWDDAFQTINKAVSVCIGYDIIYVAKGTYFENVVVTIPIGIKIIGVAGSSSTFVEGGDNDAFYLRAGGTTVEGFTIQNSWRGINIHDSDNNHIINNIIKDNTMQGIYVTWANKNIIEENEITSNNHDGIGIWEQCSENIIRTNFIESNGHYGVYIHSTSHDNEIYNNLFYNTNNAYDDGQNNHWFIIPIPGVNIRGGSGIGGNYWSDYTYSWILSGSSKLSNPDYTIPGLAGSVDECPVPGFELIVFIAALAIALIILRKKKRG